MASKDAASKFSFTVLWFCAAALIAVAAPESGYLGVSLNDLPNGGGTVIAEVQPNTPAQRGGLREGDRILAVNGKKIVSQVDVRKELEGKPAGETVSFTVKRGDKEIEAKVELGKRKQNAAALPPDKRSALYRQNQEEGLRSAVGKMAEDERKAFEETLARCEAATPRVYKDNHLGTGFLIEGGKYFVTAGHMATDAGGVGKIVTLVLSDGRVYRAKIIDYSKGRTCPCMSGVPDIAVAEVINPKGDKLPSFELAENPAVGDFAMLLGYSDGYGKMKDGKFVKVDISNRGSLPITMLGKISHAGKYIYFKSSVNAAPLPGNSGGPIVNREGKIIGIISNSDYDVGGCGTTVEGIKQYLKEKVGDGNKQGSCDNRHLKHAA